MYSSGRDQKIWATDLRNTETSVLLFEEKSPVLKVLLVESNEGSNDYLWVSTTDSDVRKWVRIEAFCGNGMGRSKVCAT